MIEMYDKWVKEFMDSWKDLNWRKTLATLDSNVKYYENPIDKPCSNFNEVIDLWKIVADNQKDIEYTYKIITCDEKFCIVNWQMKRVILPSNIVQQIDGIFQISLNTSEKCTYFKQWRFTR